MAFDPDKWATSLMRELKAYLIAGLGLTGVDDPYEVIESYPPSDRISRKQPFPVTLIHFDIDDPHSVPFGLGDNVVKYVHNDVAGTVEQWEAHCHEVELNVGVWASVESGGVSARLEALQDLHRLFNGPSARDALMVASDGIEILSFTGGMFVDDTITDLPVFRVVDMTLRIRVFSRTKLASIPFWNSAVQSPELTISGINITG